jgi:hypothetical protein
MGATSLLAWAVNRYAYVRVMTRQKGSAQDT